MICGKSALLAAMRNCTEPLKLVQFYSCCVWMVCGEEIDGRTVRGMIMSGDIIKLGIDKYVVADRFLVLETKNEHQ